MNDLTTQFSATLAEVSKSGPEWLQNLRHAGAQQFHAHGLPTRKDEAWKYTALGMLSQDQVQLDVGIVAENSFALHASPLVETKVQANMLDGRVLALNGELPIGLTLRSLQDGLSDEMPGLRSLLEGLIDAQSIESSSNGFSALNNAALQSGLVIHVAAGKDAGKVLINWSSQSADAPKLFNSRVCVILEQGAKLELLEQFESHTTNTSNIVLQLELAEQASVQHVRFQRESEHAVLITRTEVLQQAESSYDYYGFDLGGRLVRHDLHTSLLGKSAKTSLNGAYLVDGNRHVDNHARVDHMAIGGFSDQYFRGIAGGSGRAVFNTAVCVHQGADETEAKQSNANILLSRRAEIDTKPELEIYADEVVASHGATVGQLDEQAIFYMRSRGLSEQQARQLLTTAFCQSVSDKLSDPVLGEIISQSMMAVMPEFDQA